MLIPPRYTLTPKISELLQSIEASKQIIDSFPIPPEVELNIRRQSNLKSSLFSARIEGNTLTLDDIPKSSSKDQKRAEVFNILKALNWVQARRSKDITLNDILTLHKMVMESLVDKYDLGKPRSNMEAIFNKRSLKASLENEFSSSAYKAGIAIYLPPRPAQVAPLLNKLVIFINSSKEQFVPIKACLSHYTFEKIHPFLDGNGRVGRLVLQLTLAKGGFGMKGLAALEEYLDNHRSEYYRSLEESEKDVTDYLEFMLEAIAETSEVAREMVLEKQKVEIEDLLLPRRAEIFNIIKDHKIVDFDIIRRRFVGVNERTLRYDLKKLLDQGLIKKRGTTKGVWYEIV